MIEQSTEVVELFKALHAAQSELTGVRKDSKNPHFKNSYASLEAVIDTVRDPLNAHGLAFMQAPGQMVNGAVEVTTALMHVSGQWLRSTLHVPLAKQDPQGLGSAITYACRYSLMAMLGLPAVDDDADMATRSPPQRQATKPAAVPETQDSTARFMDTCRKKVAGFTDYQAMRNWWGSADFAKQAADFGLGEAHMAELKTLCAKRKTEIEGTPLRAAG
jgi:hypothetical protein